jgi:hypothetical protein
MIDPGLAIHAKYAREISMRKYQVEINTILKEVLNAATNGCFNLELPSGGANLVVYEHLRYLGYSVESFNMSTRVRISW